MSKEIGDGTPTSALENKQDAVSKPTSTMTSDQARKSDNGALCNRKNV